MDRGGIDWLAVEMFPRELQGAVDDYLTVPRDAPEWPRAKYAVLSSVRVNWACYWGGGFPGDINPYTELLNMARAKGIRVIAIEPAEYRPVEGSRVDTVGLTVRNRAWVRALPRDGRGAIFGGALHFLVDQAINVQDFMLREGWRAEDLIVYDFGLRELLPARKEARIEIIHRSECQAGLARSDADAPINDAEMINRRTDRR